MIHEVSACPRVPPPDFHVKMMPIKTTKVPNSKISVSFVIIRIVRVRDGVANFVKRPCNLQSQLGASCVLPAYYGVKITDPDRMMSIEVVTPRIDLRNH